MTKLQALVCLGVVATSLSFGGESKADLPPLDGTKFVSYSFTVEGLAGFKDFVVFAYPWSLSNGAPTREHTVIENDEPVRVGRRSPTPKLYAMPRAAYDRWKESYEPRADHENPALDALIKRPDIVKCTGGPAPRFSLPSDNGRSKIVDRLSATKIAAGACTISKVLVDPVEGVPVKKSAPPVADKPATPKSPAAPAAPESASSPPGKSGCGRCAVGSPTGQPTAVLLVSGLLAMLLLRRRRYA